MKRRVLAIHRRDPAGEECGHCVALYWGADGEVGALSKSNYAALGHRDPVFADEMAVAASYARGYLSMGITPLYFGVTTLEEVAGDLDWRFSLDDINHLSALIQEKYAYEFSTEAPRSPDPLAHEGTRQPEAAPAPARLEIRDIPDLLGRMRAVRRRGPGAQRRSPSTAAARSSAGSPAPSCSPTSTAWRRTSRRSLGVRRGDPIAILSQNALEIPVLVLALLRLGAPIVPLNPAAPPEDWAYILRHCGARGLVASSDLLAAGEAAHDGLAFAVSLDDLWNSAEAPTAAGAVPYASSSLHDELAIVLYTSGTTGSPKGVGLTHGNILANAWSMAQNFRLDRTTQFAVLPLYHAHAFGFGLMTSLLTGGHLVFTDRLDPFAWMDVIRRESVEVTSVVPTLLATLLQVKVHHFKVPTLRCVMVSSAPLEPSLAWAFEEQAGIPLVHGWGLSEYTNFACCLPPDDAPGAAPAHALRPRIPCIGPALAPTEVTVRGADGNEVGEGALGELWVRGPSRMRGYFKDEEATRSALHEDWLRTGDEGFFAVEGGRPVFFVTGRIKEIICRGAEKYSPLAIERKLVAAVPEVSGKLVVVGFPHRVHGEEIGAYLGDAGAVRGAPRSHQARHRGDARGSAAQGAAARLGGGAADAHRQGAAPQAGGAVRAVRRVPGGAPAQAVAVPGRGRRGVARGRRRGDGESAGAAFLMGGRLAHAVDAQHEDGAEARVEAYGNQVPRLAEVVGARRKRRGKGRGEAMNLAGDGGARRPGDSL